MYFRTVKERDVDRELRLRDGGVGVVVVSRGVLAPYSGWCVLSVWLYYNTVSLVAA